MNDSGNSRLVMCPGCAITIEVKGKRGRCPYCGKRVTLDEPTPTQPSASPGQYSSQPTMSVGEGQYVSYSSAGRPASASRGIGQCLGRLLSFVIAFVAIGVATSLFVFDTNIGAMFGSIRRQIPFFSSAPIGFGSTEESDVTTTISFGNVSTFVGYVPRNDAGSDLVALLHASSDQGPILQRLDAFATKPRWSSEPLSRDASQGLQVIGSEHVFVTDDDTLIALRLDDGTEAWRTPLVSPPDNNCKDCLQQVGDRVVVLQKDGSLQGFNVANGQRTWSIKLAETPRQMPLADGKLVVVNEIDRENGEVLLIDPATGKETLQFAPECDLDHPFGPEAITKNASMMVDGQDLYLFYGFFQKCVQRWDLSTGSMMWQQPMDMNLPSGLMYEDVRLVVGDQLVFATDASINNQVIAINTKTGDIKTLLDGDGYGYRIVAAHNNTLILGKWPDWDTRRHSLIGVDIRSGKELWELESQAKSTLQLMTIHGAWDVRMTPQGLVSLEVLEDKKQIEMKWIDAETGRTTRSVAQVIDERGSYTFWSALWADKMAFFNIGGYVYVFDLEAGKLVYRMR